MVKSFSKMFYKSKMYTYGTANNFPKDVAIC